jgi:hypothetical protein
LKPGNDIEDRFANAVKLALKARGTIDPSAVIIAEAARMRGHRRFGQWHIALLYVALTATVAILVVAALLD